MRITFFIILLITILFTRCSFRGFFAKKYIIETVDEYCDFVDVDTSFIIKVIDYAPANEMKTIATASNCLGITITNDTIRVLSLYNADTTINLNDMIKVLPQKKPTDYVHILVGYNTEVFPPKIKNLQKRKYKTIYGKLHKIR